MSVPRRFAVAAITAAGPAVLAYLVFIQTSVGQTLENMALRRTLFKYRLHQDQELFDRAYGYVREYY